MFLISLHVIAYASPYRYFRFPTHILAILAIHVFISQLEVFRHDKSVYAVLNIFGTNKSLALDALNVVGVFVPFVCGGLLAGITFVVVYDKSTI
jgi:hypothetical protein